MGMDAVPDGETFEMKQLQTNLLGLLHNVNSAHQILGPCAGGSGQITQVGRRSWVGTCLRGDTAKFIDCDNHSRVVETSSRKTPLVVQ